ncbi:hypothetical protein E2C01_022837 [Portunus trituberculatus]|uniref:Uncharacterized protein n=1 Tax=Portunus trituberculatus TaxID=210409 RepID=A0A5B7E8Q0_PORTR|nr:hypothetical protein [Portunus trituberculatus]
MFFFKGSKTRINTTTHPTTHPNTNQHVCNLQDKNKHHNTPHNTSKHQPTCVTSKAVNVADLLGDIRGWHLSLGHTPQQHRVDTVEGLDGEGGDEDIDDGDDEDAQHHPIVELVGLLCVVFPRHIVAPQEDQRHSYH